MDVWPSEDFDVVQDFLAVNFHQFAVGRRQLLAILHRVAPRTFAFFVEEEAAEFLVELPLAVAGEVRRTNAIVGPCHL